MEEPIFARDGTAFRDQRIGQTVVSQQSGSDTVEGLKDDFDIQGEGLEDPFADGPAFLIGKAQNELFF